MAARVHGGHAQAARHALHHGVERGARSETDIDVRVIAPLQAGPDDVLAAQVEDHAQQLPELEEALRAVTTNNFADWTSGTAPNLTSVDWTLSGTTATATITPPATRYGNSGVTGTAKIRIDNYDAFNRPAAWANGTAYRIGDLIGDAGTWYRCIAQHSGSATITPTGTNAATNWENALSGGATGWASDLTRTVPVNGRFTKRQRDVYDAVLRLVRVLVQPLQRLDLLAAPRL